MKKAVEAQRLRQEEVAVAEPTRDWMQKHLCPICASGVVDLGGRFTDPHS